MCHVEWLWAFHEGQAGQEKQFVALYVMEQLGCIELTIGNDMIEILWLSIMGQAGKQISLWYSAITTQTR